MIIVNIKDGLGNQMFQYATGYVLAKKINTSVICDTRYLIEKKKNPPKDYVIREFDLDIFGIKASKIETFKLLPTFQFFKNYIVRHNVTKLLDKFNQNVLMERSRKIDLRIIKNKRKNLYKPIKLLIFILILQVILGISTLISGLNIYLASLHQIMGVLLVFTAVNLYYLNAK